MLERASQAGETSLALACALAAWLEGRQGASRELDLERVFVPLLSSPRPDPAWQREARRLCQRAGVGLEQARAAAKAPWASCYCVPIPIVSLNSFRLGAFACVAVAW